MSVEQTRKKINQLDKDIAMLEKKFADYSKKEAVARSNAARVGKYTPKNASLATIKLKQSKIEKLNADAVKAAEAKADINKKIADKHKIRAEAQVKLQKEESAELKKDDKAQAILQHNYEKLVEELVGQTQAQATALPQQHLYAATAEEEYYDVFISYASEDKESFVDGLYKELDSRGIEVWYDVISIKWGDSLRSKIDEGLRKSKFGIVILSNNYIRKGWTQLNLTAYFNEK